MSLIGWGLKRWARLGNLERVRGVVFKDTFNSLTSILGLGN